ncbi:MAG: recombinase family protein [Planctomycetota bacterium]|nr:recombinase family protein [Planctomycetota bacterium]
MATGKQIVAYYRVSTEKQGKSGLGLEGQQAALRGYSQSVGGKLLKSYTEVESGKRSDRPELAKALAHAKRSGATLVIAKLDRLARNVHLVSGLMESKVDFVCCDNPHANRLTIHILAAIAEHEAEAISLRTKAALAAYKERGGKLGASLPQCRNLTLDARKRGAEQAGRVAKKMADAAYTDLAQLMLDLRKAGYTQQQIADKLNQEGHTTRRGKPWNQVQVLRVLQRAEALAGQGQ